MPQRHDPSDAINRWRAEAHDTPLVDVVERHYRNITLRGHGNNRFGPCPKCGGDDRFSINKEKNLWNCRGCVKGGDPIDLIRHVDNIGFDEACEMLTGRAKPAGSGTVHQLRDREEEYFYYNASGKAVMKVERWRDANGKKSFVQYHPDGNGGWVRGGLPDGQRVPYRLPELLATPKHEYPILIPEGERKCNALVDLGFAASCNVGGTGMGWTPELTPHFAGYEIIILCDNDNKGREHGDKVAVALHSVAKSVRVLHIEDGWPCATKQDIYDFIRQLKGDAEEKAKAVVQLLSHARDWPIIVTGHTTEEEVAITFAGENSSKLRYLAARKQWLIKQTASIGEVWVSDTTLQALHRADLLIRRNAEQAHSPKDKNRIMGKKFADNVEGIARRELVIDPKECDADHFLANTPNGLFDLRACKPEPYDERVCCKITLVAPDFEMAMPLWQAFLERVTKNNDELISYLQRCAGYWLTGSTREQKLFFLYGTGANGKSVFVSTLAGIMGEYAAPAPIELLLKTKYERHETEKAWLMGARMVRMSEPSEGDRWHEGKVKELTGEDTIVARQMHGDYFKIPLQCKFVISGNNKPTFSQVDEAIRRRIELIPFEVQIPEAERDVELLDKLRAEWPAILTWMMEGARCWYEAGLQTPEIVRAATSDYAKEQDLVKAWIEDHSLANIGGWASIGDLFQSWKDWCIASGEYVGTKQKLTARLEKLGYERHDTKKARGFFGLLVGKGDKVSHWSDER